MATAPTSVEDLRRQLDQDEDRQAAAQRNAQLLQTHPAYATQATAQAYQGLRYPTDPGVNAPPSPAERQQQYDAAPDRGILTGKPQDGGVSSGEGEANDLNKSAGTLSGRSLQSLENIAADIEKSDLPLAARATLRDELRRVKRKSEYIHLTAVTNGRPNLYA